MSVQSDNRSAFAPFLLFNQNVSGTITLDQGFVLDTQGYLSVTFAVSYISSPGQDTESVSFTIVESDDQSFVAPTLVPDSKIIGSLSNLEIVAGTGTAYGTRGCGIINPQRYIQVIGQASAPLSDPTRITMWAIGGLTVEPYINVTGGM